MKLFLLLFLQFLSSFVFAQKKEFIIHNISLPPEISFYDNQFSGLYISNNTLYLLSESRLQDKAEAKIYAIATADLDRKMIDTSFTLPYKKISIKNLEILREKMAAISDEYEGLEAMVIKDKNVFFTVETATSSDNCYLLKGILNDSIITLNKNDIVLLPKPITPVGTHVYNAGYECLALNKNVLFPFFEFNYFPKNNKVSMIALKNFNEVSLTDFSLQPLPFRITDITATTKNNYTAINYFYKGSGPDEVYRVPLKDTVNMALIKDSAGFKNYCRLVNIKFKKDRFTWEPIWEFPVELMSYNWEGISSYKEGYFIINDKYTPKRPYKTVLLYLQTDK